MSLYLSLPSNLPYTINLLTCVFVVAVVLILNFSLFCFFKDVETIFRYLCGMQAVAGLPESSVRSVLSTGNAFLLPKMKVVCVMGIV